MYLSLILQRSCFSYSSIRHTCHNDVNLPLYQ
uniref:Uncharacterized protein n=1 Tax=Rhizophora mucronata TaxID=61149 RepID=A0A2P2PTG1_RHIMU